MPAGHAWVPGGTAAQDARSYGRASPSRVLLAPARLLRAYQKYVFTPGPLLGAALLAGLCGLARFRRRLGGAVALPWATGAALLLFPIATADMSYRYLLPVLPFAFLAAALAFAPGPEAEKPGKAETLTLPEKPVTPDVFRQTVS